MKKILTIASIILLGFTSCTKENDYQTLQSNLPKVQLLSEVTGFNPTFPVNATVYAKVRGYLKQGTTISKVNVSITKKVSNIQVPVISYITTSFQVNIIGQFSSNYPDLRNFDLTIQLYSPMVTTGEYTYTINVETTNGFISTNVVCGPYTYQ